MRKNVDTFESLIAPVVPDAFFSEFWERRFLHLKNEPGAFDHLFSIRDVDRWFLSVRGGPADSVAISTPEGSTNRFDKYRPQDIDLGSVYEAFAGGRSVVLNYLENCWPPLSGLVTMLGRYFCAEIGVNVYLTPPGKRTFSTHVDDHDAFVLQVDGEKIWRLHELTVLSVMRLQHKQDLQLTSEWGPGRLETPLAAEVRLQPGDVLYVPRGTPHCAVAAEDKTSLHLTISVMPLYWTDFLKAAVEQAAIHAPALRKALRPGFVSDPEAGSSMHESFTEAMSAFQEHSSYESTLEVMRRNRIRQQGYPLDGHFAQIEALAAATAASVLERREGVLCALDNSEPGFCSLRFASRHVRGPERLRRSFEFVRDTPRFVARQIPGLTDEGRVVLVRRLIREGLLRFAES